VVIPNGVTVIGNSAFAFCSGLTSVSIPAGVTSIGEKAFQGCSSLRSVTCLASTPPSVQGNTFNSIKVANCRLYVPSGGLSLYRTTNVWKDFDIFDIDGSVVAVEVSPVAAIMRNNSTMQFNAAVTITGGASQAITWSISGNNSPSTSISASGQLKVTGGETASLFTVTATSVFDNTKSDMAAVILTASQGSINGTVDNAEYGAVVYLYLVNSELAKSGGMTGYALINSATIDAQGNVNYQHTAGAGLSNLKSDTPEGYTLIGSTTTNAAGNYIFENLPAGTYKVMVEIDGCTSEPSDAVNLTGNGTANSVNFTVDNTNNTVKPEGITGVEIEAAPLAQMYPNPTGGVLNLHFDTPGTYRVTIATISGGVMLRQTVSDQVKQIDVSSYPSGVYLVIIDDGKRQSATRIVKE
jgi:hypothetical protein